MNEIPDNKPQPNLWQDTIECWRRLPNKTFFFVLLAAWLALFQFFGNSILGYVHTSSLFSWLKNQYDTVAADDGHGNFIPFLVAGLFWWKRHELLSLPLKMWWPGLLILIFALALHLAGYAIQQPFFSHHRAVHRHFWFDGTGMGTRLAAKERVSFLAFYFFQFRWDNGAKRSLFRCNNWSPG